MTKSTIEITIIAVLLILFVVLICYYTRCKRSGSSFFFIKLLFSMALGVGLLFPAQLVLTACGYLININIFTGAISAVLGIPGVILVAILAVAA